MNSTIKTYERSFAVFVAAACILASAAWAGEPTSLSNGVAVTGLSGAAGSETFYKIDVPSGQDTLEIATSGGTGDVDLYVKRGSQPTATSYDYRPYKVGNSETVDVNNPTAGTWYVMLRGYAGYSGVTLKATYAANISVKALTNGVAATGISGAASVELYYSIEVPAGQTKLEIAMSGGTGDADLYVKNGSLPTTSSYDYRPFLVGNNETVSVDNPGAGTWYIMLRGYSAYSGITLLASYGGSASTGTVLENGSPVTGLSGAASSEKMYRFDLPAGQSNLEIKMSGGTGDADLYVRLKSPPTTTEYDYRPFQAGNNETVTVSAPAAGTWFVLVRGYTDYSGVTLKASWGSVTVLQDEVPVNNLSGALGSETFFQFSVPSGQGGIVFKMSGGTGNADMYIKKGTKPTTSNYDWHPTDAGNTESINVGGGSDLLQGTWYIMLKGAQAYSGVTLLADYQPLETVETLSNGVPVTNLSGATGGQRYFEIDVPSGQQKFEIRISGGTGDADLYVKRGSKPTTSDYDYRPNLIGNDEAVTIDNPTSGSWYIMIRGHQAFSGVTLLATYGGTPPETVVTLQNGVPVTGISGSANGEKFYKIAVPSGQSKLDIVMSGGTGDADLYVHKGSKPTTSDWDYRPYLIGNNESVTIDNPQADTYYIMIRGYGIFGGITLKATYTPVAEQIITLTNGVPLPGLSGASGSEKFYKITVPAGQDFLTIETSGGTGDVDLYVKKGAKPSLTSWDYRPYLIGNNEKVEISNPAAATWYILVRGYQAYSGLTLEATYGVDTPPPPVAYNFIADSNCVALWRFEPGKLTSDSVGTNTLTNQAVTTEPSDYKEGLASARFFASNGDWAERNWLSIADASLSTKFPGKNGTSNKRFSICFWVKFDSIPDSVNEWTLVTKANWEIGRASYAVTCAPGGKIRLYIGNGTSGFGDSLDHGSVLSPGQWYHVAVTFDNSTHTGTISVWDDAAHAILGTDATKTNFLAMNNNVDPFLIGGVDGMWYKYMDGLMDEVAVLNDLLTSAEIAEIRAGIHVQP